MNPSEEDEVKDLLEDLDLQKVIYDNLLETRPDDSESLAETLQTIKKLEARIAQLLGQTPANATANASTASPAIAPATPSGLPPPSSSPPAPTGHWRDEIPNAFHVPRGPLRTATVPHDPFFDAYTPSSAPSPFAMPSSSNQRPYLPPMTQDSRKRARHGSGSSSTTLQPPKRPATNNPQAEIAKIEAEMARQLAEHDLIYDQLRNPDNIESTARLEGTSEEQALQNINEEDEDGRQAIQYQFQMDKDGVLARMLQAQEEPNLPDYSPSVDLPPNPPLPPPLPLPRQSHFGSEPSPARGPPALYVPAKSKYPPPYMPHRPLDRFLPENQPSSDDLQEITRDTFQARFGDPAIPANHMPANPMPYRRLPWMPETAEQHQVMRAFDLVREQQELDDDEVDFERYKEQDFPEDIRNLLTGIKDINAATKADKDSTPGGLRVTLMKHQKIGVAWMKAKEESKHKGGILADDMGLGKTIQTIALLVARPPTDPERHPCLIVAPKALMDQWRLEIERHIKPGKHQLSVFVFHDKQRQVPWRELKYHDVIITTFGTLTANYKQLLKADELQKEGRDATTVKRTRDTAVLFGATSKWHRVIVDEAQNIKNPLAKAQKACCRLDSEFRWCLTGTPMMNRLEDLQSLLTFLRIRPYNNKDKFKNDFTRPMKNCTANEQTMQQLRVLVKSVCLRRTKNSKLDGQPILQLPPRVVEKIHVVFNEHEKELYDALSNKTQRHISRLLNEGALGRNYSHVLVLLLRLRQACCHPHLVHGYNLEAPTNVEGVDLLANAKLLASDVVQRIKNGSEEDDGACPICMDSVENAVIYIPCGHSVCSECFARISDPTVQARDEASGLIKCQNCRGPVDPVKVTDANSFKKAWEPSSDPDPKTTDDSAKDSATETDSETEVSESESEWDSDGVRKKPEEKTFAQLRAAAQKNKKEKKKYLRRLEKNWVPSAKIEKTMEILQINEDRGKGEKTIVFSQFTSLLDFLEVPIRRRGWTYVRFDGSMNITDRNAAVTQFTQDPSCRIMLVSLKAGNAGLNLVAASHVVLFDPFWNPYVEDQAIDRAHRIGQTRDVFVHRLLIEGTVEDRICELQDKKRDLISGALDEGGSLNVSRLDTRELAFLFGVRT